MVARCFQERFLGLMESRSSWKIVKLFFFEETGRCPEKRNRKLHAEQHIGDVQVVCILCLLALGDGKKRLKRKIIYMLGSRRDKLPATASDGYELAGKTLGMAGRKEFRDEAWYGGKTNNVPLDIKTAFDEAKRKHVSNILDSHNTHGWLIAVLLS